MNVSSYKTQLGSATTFFESLNRCPDSKTKAVVEMLRKSTGTRSIHLQGETGSGKDVAAGAVREISGRIERPFVVYSCGLKFGDPSIQYSQFFGHESRSISGVDRKQEGIFAQANDGILLLDDVSELSLDNQALILDALGERRFRPIGGDSSCSDFVLVTSTNADLPKMVSEGKFRKDLFYRIAGFPIEIPPLRERADDVEYLANDFARTFSKGALSVSSKAMDVLKGYSWPGNVRELRDSIERAVILASGNQLIEPDHFLIGNFCADLNEASEIFSQQFVSRLTTDGNLLNIKQMIDEEIIRIVLNRFNGSRNLTARILGISLDGLRRKIIQYRIDIPHGSRPKKFQ